MGILLHFHSVHVPQIPAEILQLVFLRVTVMLEKCLVGIKAALAKMQHKSKLLADFAFHSSATSLASQSSLIS